MANFITLSILLAVCIVSPVFSAPATQVTIYHAESGRLVRATLAGVAADGITGGQYCYSHYPLHAGPGAIYEP